MEIMKPIYFFLLSILFISDFVHAETDSPWRIGVREGASYFNNVDKSVTDKGNLSGGLFLGYQFTPWFAVEGGYTYLGQPELDNNQGSYKAQGADLVSKLSYSLNDKFDIFMKLGTYYYAWNANNTGVKHSDNGWAATAGIGAEYFINNDWSTRIEHQRYSNIASSDINYYGLSFVYHWGASTPIEYLEPVITEPVISEPVVVDETATVLLETLKTSVYFDHNSTNLNQDAISLFAPFQARLNEFEKANILIIGHTDSCGTEEYNQRLSENRAAVVAEALRIHFNIDSSRIISEGKGEKHPVSANNSVEGRAANRRVEIISPSIEV